MSWSSLFLLLTIFFCCSAYMRKNAGNPQHFVDQVESDHAKAYELRLNTTFASGNRTLINGLFEQSFKLKVCGKDFDLSKIMETFVKRGQDYKFKVQSWEEKRETIEVKFIVLIKSQPKFPINGIISKSSQGLITGSVNNCRPKRDMVTEVKFKDVGK